MSDKAWSGCFPAVRKAIAAVYAEWDARSALAKGRGSLYRLIERHVDVAWSEYLASLSRPDVACTVWGAGGSPSCFARCVGFAGIAEATRQAIYDFDEHPEFGTDSGKCYVDTLEFLRQVWTDCSFKQPKHLSAESDPSKNLLRANEFCELCGQPTELYSYLSVAGVGSGCDAQRKFSGRYCVRHKAREAGDYCSSHQQAARKKEEFLAEVLRLRRQSWSSSVRRAQTGNFLLDEFYVMLVNTRKFFPDEVGRIRDEARALVDQKISDAKKQIVVLLAQGKSQTEIAAILGVKHRQSVSKMLAKVPISFRLDLVKADPAWQPDLPPGGVYIFSASASTCAR